MNEDRLERIEAKLEAIVAAMDHASGEPDAVSRNDCRVCKYWRDGICTSLGASIPINEVIGMCGTYEPNVPGKLIRCRDCRHWSPDEEARLGECSVTLAYTYGERAWPEGCGHYQPEAEPTPAMYCGHCREGICNLDHLECRPIKSCREAKVKANWPPKPEPQSCGTCRFFQDDVGADRLGWCYQRCHIMRKDHAPDCNRHEPTS